MSASVSKKMTHAENIRGKLTSSSKSPGLGGKKNKQQTQNEQGVSAQTHSRSHSCRYCSAGTVVKRNDRKESRRMIGCRKGGRACRSEGGGKIVKEKKPRVILSAESTDRRS